MSYLTNAGLLLLQLLFSLASLLFVLRLLLQWSRASFYNPICQFFYTATNPVLMPLRKPLPTVGGFNIAAALISWLIMVLEVWVLSALQGRFLNLPASLVLGFAALLSLVLGVYFVMLLLVVLISLANPGSDHPLSNLLHQLTEPLVRPVRRRLPPLGPLDLSVMVVFVGILLARVLIVAPISDLGVWLATAG
jgi:YggT family protein